MTRFWNSGAASRGRSRRRLGRDLTGTLIADIVLQLLSYVAQTEREFIRQRQAEGIAAARAKGVHLGRKPMKVPDNFLPVYDQWKREKISARKATCALGVSHHTFIKWANTQLAYVSESTP